MDVFRLRDCVVRDYASYVRSFVEIRDRRIDEFVHKSLDEQALWPHPLIQINPTFESGGWIDDLVREGRLHPGCREIFRIKSPADPIGAPMRLHKHQVEAIDAARRGESYVLTTGTGSGKSLAYIVPIVDHVLRYGSGQGIRAIVVYPMNALCNSQFGELEKFLKLGFVDGKQLVRFERYTGQESQEQRDRIVKHPPDVLLTNYIMLELLLTRPFERPLIEAARGLRFLVLDELHTYRGRQGADVALLVRRLRSACEANELLCVGTSATMFSGDDPEEQQGRIAQLAGRLFGADVLPANVIRETLIRATPDLDFDQPQVVAGLRAAVLDEAPVPRDYARFVHSPLASWLESRLGIRREPNTGRLIRAEPASIVGDRGVASELSRRTGLDPDLCERAIRRWLLAGYECEGHPETRVKPFAFRLHQFISRGESVYASLEDGEDRYLSLSGQQYAPGSEKRRLLLPLAFCRECGAEYYTVWKWTDASTGEVRIRPRDLGDRVNGEDGIAGFLRRDPARPWPADSLEVLDRLPDDWLETDDGQPRLRPSLREDVPQPLWVRPDGSIGPDGLDSPSPPHRFDSARNAGWRTRRGGGSQTSAGWPHWRAGGGARRRRS